MPGFTLRAHDDTAARLLSSLPSPEKMEGGSVKLNPSPGDDVCTSLLLHHPNDRKFLSELLCLVRSQIEAFVTSADGSGSHRTKRGVIKGVKAGQVGIRCVHCVGSKGLGRTPLDEEMRKIARGAVKYPRSISQVHQAVRNWQRHHMLACPAIPEEVKAQFAALRSSEKQRRSGIAGRQYWEDSCQRMGMIDTEDGIWLRTGAFVREDRRAAGVCGRDEGPGSVSSGESVKKSISASSIPHTIPEAQVSAPAVLDLCLAEKGSEARPEKQDSGREDANCRAGLLISKNGDFETAPMGASQSNENTGPRVLAETPTIGRSQSLDEIWVHLSSENEQEDDLSLSECGSLGLDLGCNSPAIVSLSNGEVLEMVFLAQSTVRACGSIRHLPSSADPTYTDGIRNAEGCQQLDMPFLGAELYELFSGQSPYGHENNRKEEDGDLRDIIRAVEDEGDTFQQQRKKERQPKTDGYVPLSELGLPSALCCLVSSLLDYSADSHRNTYASFEEVEHDLHLMTADPEQFLFPTSPGDLCLAPDALYGRKKESSELFAAFGQATKTNSKEKVMALISGYSGTGKSMLIGKATLGFGSSGACCVSGKFDEMRQLQPLSAIFSALNDYCDLLLRDVERVDCIREAIVVAAGRGGGRVLVNLIPNLGRIIPSAEDMQPEVQVTGREALQRLMFLLRVLFRVTCSRSHPVVLFLDDLQWADKLSLEVMASLVTDVEIDGLFFVGAYRDNEIGPKHPLKKCLGVIHDSASIDVRSIHVNNLNMDSINSLVSDMLHLTPRMTRSLAEAVLHKTGGNALFVAQFLPSLRDEGLLRFSLKTKRWEWDVKKINDRSIGDNVVDLMTTKMLRLAPKVREALRIAAAFGAQCQSVLLQIIDRAPERIMDTVTALDLAVSEGILIKSGSTYKFSHDQIQQAAYLLTPESEHGAFHLSIGRLLLKWSSAEEMETNLFVVVDQLYRGSGQIDDRDEKVNLAQLSLIAGQKASRMSAFLAMSAYLNAGIGLLSDSDWDCHKDLCFNLYDSCAEAEYILGDFDKMKVHLEEVLARAETLQEKMRAYYTLVQSTGAQGNKKDAIDIALSVLGHLGEIFPAAVTGATVKKELLMTQAILDTKSKDDLIQQLEVMEDAGKKEAMKFLDAISYHLLGGKREYLPLVVCRLVQLSLSHGLCMESASAFARYGLILCGRLGDLSGGYRFGKLAMSVLHKLRVKDNPASILVMVCFVNNWIEPIQSSLEPLKRAIDVGLATGDTHHAMLAAHGYAGNALFAGQQLGPLQHEIKMHSKQMLEYNHHFMYRIGGPHRQAISNLIGESANPIKLIGEEMDEENTLNNPEEKGSRGQIGSLILFYRMWLEYLFGEHELAWESAEKNKDWGKNNVSRFAFVCDHIFYSGLAAISLARKERQTRYAKTIDATMNQMKIWASSGRWNCQHKLHLMKAERAYLEGDMHGAEKAFDAAIDLAGDHRFIHDQALALERAGIFYSERGDHDVATDFFLRAQHCYVRWGAHCKAANVQDCYL